MSASANPAEQVKRDQITDLRALANEAHDAINQYVGAVLTGRNWFIEGLDGKIQKAIHRLLAFPPESGQGVPVLMAGVPVIVDRNAPEGGILLTREQLQEAADQMAKEHPPSGKMLREMPLSEFQKLAKINHKE